MQVINFRSNFIYLCIPLVICLIKIKELLHLYLPNNILKFRIHNSTFRYVSYKCHIFYYSIALFIFVCAVFEQAQLKCYILNYFISTATILQYIFKQVKHCYIQKLKKALMHQAIIPVIVFITTSPLLMKNNKYFVHKV